MGSALKEILRLSIAERILLVEELWDSIASESKEESSSSTESQKEEIERCLALYKCGQTKTYSWKEVKANLNNP
jgi:putative addiction module component (TIGR02574 family)